MIKCILYTICLLLTTCAVYPNMRPIKDTAVRYIIIASIGPVSGSGAISPLVISTKEIDSIEFDEGNYEEKRKYFAFENRIVSENQFHNLFDYLKQTNVDVVRKSGFINSQFILIADYRKNKGQDYVLVSLKSFTATMFFINNLHCFMKTNEFSEDVLNWGHIQLASAI